MFHSAGNVPTGSIRTARITAGTNSSSVANSRSPTGCALSPQKSCPKPILIGHMVLGTRREVWYPTFPIALSDAKVAFCCVTLVDRRSECDGTREEREHDGNGNFRASPKAAGSGDCCGSGGVFCGRTHAGRSRRCMRALCSGRCYPLQRPSQSCGGGPGVGMDLLWWRWHRLSSSQCC